MSDEQQHLTVGEFSRWSQHFNLLISEGFERVEGKIDTSTQEQQEVNTRHGERITAVEVKQQATAASAGKWSAGISAVVAGIVTGILGYFSFGK